VAGQRERSDHEVDGSVIPCGAKVIPFYASANRDPEKFPDPDTLIRTVWLRQP